jgi:hypothetical protein
MIIGSVVGVEEVGKLDTGDIDSVVQHALDEISTNPIIDAQIRKDPIIMRELQGVVTRSLKQKGSAKAS